jgi:hypothetical protein
MTRTVFASLFALALAAGAAQAQVPLDGNVVLGGGDNAEVVYGRRR